MEVSTEKKEEIKKDEAPAMPDSVPALALMCNDFSKIINPIPTADIKQQVTGIGTSIEANLTRISEFGTVAESICTSSQKTSKVLIPKLVDRAQEVKELYKKIDAFQIYLDKMENSVDKMEARIDLVEKEYGGGVVSKLFSSLGSLFDDRRKKPLCLDWDPINFIVKSNEYFTEEKREVRETEKKKKKTKLDGGKEEKEEIDDEEEEEEQVKPKQSQSQTQRERTDSEETSTRSSKGTGVGGVDSGGMAKKEKESSN